jgi:hypothetical protein
MDERVRVVLLRLLLRRGGPLNARLPGVEVEAEPDGDDVVELRQRGGRRSGGCWRAAREVVVRQGCGRVGVAGRAGDDVTPPPRLVGADGPLR